MRRPEFIGLMTMLALASLILIGSYAKPIVADYRSTFLIALSDPEEAAEHSTLNWLSNDFDDTWRAQTLDLIKNNGDTHADVYVRSTDRGFGYIDGVDPASWRSRLNMLRDRGVAPVIWLISDDSPDIVKLGLQNQIDYQRRSIETVDDLASHYVLCLECDEYYRPQDVGVLIQNARQHTNKPIGIHLTPQMIKDRNTERLKAYLAQADIFYLQTGWVKEIGEAEFRRRIEYALTLGKPVVVSEYHKEGTTAEARRAGDIACSYAGVVGTGNGRANGVCEDLQWALAGGKKEPWYEKWDDELNVMGLILVTLSAVEFMDLPFAAKFNYYTDSGYELEFSRKVTASADAGMTFRNDGKIMGFFRATFDTLKFKPPEIKDVDR